MKISSLFILEPPYTMARRFESAPPALGSVALFDAVVTRPTTNDVKGQMDLAPWCPLCLLADTESGMRSTRRLPRTCVVFGMNEADGASAILKAVSSRPRPTPSDLVDWITKRTRLPGLSRTLSDLFSRPAFRRNEAALLPYSVREQMRQLGDWTALEWQRAALLAEVAADRTLLNRTMSADDDSAGELRSAMVALLGVPEREFHNRYGWEWVLEASLRRSGFFARAMRGVRPLHQRTAVVPSVEAWGESWGEEAFAGARATA
ncbi:MAG: hypothetical protein ACT4P7_22670 [Gemmatimonadaceae bacterium]